MFFAAAFVLCQSPWKGSTADQFLTGHPAAGPVTTGLIAPPKGAPVEYKYEGKVYEGYVSLPGQPSNGAPGALVAHQWMGLGDYEKARADELAAMGYVAFALDVYGKGVRCNTAACASAAMKNATADIPRLLGLVSAGTTQLIKAGANTSALVAIGYCFGGSMVLELARHPLVGASAAVEYKAVSSVHGVLAPLSKASKSGEVTARVQVPTSLCLALSHRIASHPMPPHRIVHRVPSHPIPPDASHPLGSSRRARLSRRSGAP